MQRPAAKPRSCQSWYNGLGLEDHAAAAAVRRVIHGAVFVGRTIARVVGLDGQQTPGNGAGHHAGGQRRGEKIREEGYNVYSHGLNSSSNAPHDDPPRRDFHDKVADSRYEGFAFSAADHVHVCRRHGYDLGDMAQRLSLRIDNRAIH